MPLAKHEEYNISKLQKVNILFGLQRVPKKEVAHLLKAFELAHPKAEPVFVIASDNSEAEKPLERHQNLLIPLMLDYNKLRQHLVAEGHFLMSIDAYMEASFAIGKADDPLRRQLHKELLKSDTQRVASEDPRRIGFPADCPILSIVTPCRA